jgi:hypothetical protein
MSAVYKIRRKFPRYHCDTGVRIHLERANGGFWGTLSDISAGGCYIHTFSPLPIDQPMVLKIKANNSEINVAGKTVSSHPGVGMGVAFGRFISADGEQVLKSYIAHLANLPRTNENLGVFH